MLSLINISKTYLSKSKQSVHALKDINLELPDKGMVFILGKSGSGKSTLLNILGGLDDPTNGEIFVDGTSMKNFTKCDYDTYRRNYIGFVFQEFNLLKDFNVRDNIALSLQLSKSDNIDATVTEALKKVELNDEYLNRYVDEMSGGEKQRIAIARAIVKDSRMILADEPTGNLDSTTGESIWNILKNLADERLVVVVSHDRDSAEKYANRIIEISDGRIVGDSQPTVQHENIDKPFCRDKQGLSFGARLKMGFNNLKLRKSKTVSVILLTIFSIFSLLVTQMSLSFSPEVALANYIVENDIEYFTVSQGYTSDYNHMFEPYDTMLRNSTFQYIAENSNHLKSNIVNSKQDLLDMGLSFVGESLELDDNSYYATTYAIQQCYDREPGFVEVDGEFVEIVKELHPIEFLIGKRVMLDGQFSEESPCILAGVILAESKNELVLPMYFYNENFSGILGRSSKTFNATDPKETTMKLSDSKYDGKFEITDYINSFLIYNYSVVISQNGLLTQENTPNLNLEDNEIIMSYELYARIFGADSKWYYINRDLTEIRNTPKEIGQELTLQFYEYGKDELLVDYGTVKIAGIAFSADGFDNGTKNTIGTSKKLAKKICRDLSSESVLIQVDSVQNLKKFVTTLRNDHEGFISNAGFINNVSPNGEILATSPISSLAYEFDQVLKVVSIVLLVIGAVLLLILILMFINLISFSIANRKKEIGILSALGTSNKDITSIFLLETMVISSISFVVILTLAIVFQYVFNKVLSSGYMLSIVFPFLQVNILTIATLVVTAFGLLLLTALLPVRKIIKLKPVDAIRNI